MELDRRLPLTLARVCVVVPDFAALHVAHLVPLVRYGLRQGVSSLSLLVQVPFPTQVASRPCLDLHESGRQTDSLTINLRTSVSKWSLLSGLYLDGAGLEPALQLVELVVLDLLPPALALELLAAVEAFQPPLLVRERV